MTTCRKKNERFYKNIQAEMKKILTVLDDNVRGGSLFAGPMSIILFTIALFKGGHISNDCVDNIYDEYLNGNADTIENNEKMMGVLLMNPQYLLIFVLFLYKDKFKYLKQNAVDLMNQMKNYADNSSLKGFEDYDNEYQVQNNDISNIETKELNDIRDKIKNIYLTFGKIYPSEKNFKYENTYRTKLNRNSLDKIYNKGYSKGDSIFLGSNEYKKTRTNKLNSLEDTVFIGSNEYKNNIGLRKTYKSRVLPRVKTPKKVKSKTRPARKWTRRNQGQGSGLYEGGKHKKNKRK